MSDFRKTDRGNSLQTQKNRFGNSETGTDMKNSSCLKKNGRKYAAVYSGGKDGHLALMKKTDEGAEISCLIYIDGGESHTAMYHDLCKTDIIKLHSSRMNIPLVICPALPEMKAGRMPLSEMFRYAADTAAEKYSFDAICCGTTDGDDKGSAEYFREAGRTIGIDIETPLSGLSVTDILNLQTDRKVKAIIVAAENGKLPASVLGREAGSSLARILCHLNERGISADGNDFQTLVTDSPLFSSPVEILKTEIIKDIERAYLEITEFK